jgi:WhiB family transcriptional regulator, redox-sensing transcriptional regulator
MWQERAACAQVGGDIWHPEKNASTREAKEICLRCDAVQECLQWALDNNEQYGVWGGLSER